MGQQSTLQIYDILEVCGSGPLTFYDGVCHPAQQSCYTLPSDGAAAVTKLAEDAILYHRILVKQNTMSK